MPTHRFLNQLSRFPEYLRTAGPVMPDSDLRRAPAGGGFSLVEHACHLRDYEEAGCLHRILRMLVEESPSLEDFAGERIALHRSYCSQNFFAAVEDFARLRQSSVRILESLSAGEWQRTAILGNMGRISIRELVEIVASHDRTHRDEIEVLLQEIRSNTANAASEDGQDVAALRVMAREFTEGFNTRDVDRMMRFYGSSYVDVNLRDPMQSRGQRREYFSQMMRREDFGLRVNPDEIVVHNSVAFVRGRIEIIDGNGAVSRELRYLEISRKESDGWKAIWGIDGPVQEYDAGVLHFPPTPVPSPPPDSN